jgi:hypothetical protein
MRRTLSLVLVATALASLLGCGVNLGRIRTSGAGTAAKKDCAACDKMCSVAADAEKNPDALAACKADCKKTCSE